MPDPLALELESIRRGISRADLMREQSLAPRRIDSPTQGLAQLAQAFVARRAGTQAEERLSAFQESGVATGEADTAAILEASKGSREDLARAMVNSNNPIYKDAGLAILTEKAPKKADPKIMKDAAGFQRYTTGAQKGERVFPNVEKASDEPKPHSFIQLQNARDTALGEGRDKDATEIQALLDKQSTIVGRTPGDIQTGTKAQTGKMIASADFFDGQTLKIDEVIAAATKDPLLLGAPGAVRRAGQTFFGVTEGLTKLIGGSAMDTAFAHAKELLPDTDLSEKDKKELFSDPEISKLRLYENSLGLALARLRVPNNRIPVEVIRRSIKDAQLTGMISQQDAINRLKEIRSQFVGASKLLRSRSGTAQNPITEQQKPTEMSEDDFAELQRLRQEQGI